MLPLADLSTLNIQPVTPNDGFMTGYERDVLIALAWNLGARAVLEIGVQDGRGASILLTVPTIRRYYGVDVEAGYIPSLKTQLHERPPQPGVVALHDPRFTLILKPRGSLDLVPDELPRFDMALIDGDHGRAAVTHDTHLARSVVRPGGIIIWHDYYTGDNYDPNSGAPVVRSVLEEMQAAGSPIERVENTWLAIERR